MGSSNALAAYRLYAGKIPPTSLNILLYMALVALDRDEEPSWWEGHEVLSEMAFGRQLPSAEEAASTKERARERDAGLRAVERAITPLFTAGAITTTRHASGRAGRVTTVRYRLWTTKPAPDGKRREPPASTRRKTSGAKASTRRKTSGAKASTRRKVVPAPDENRRTKEEEEDLKQERDNTSAALDLTDVEGADARPDQDQIDVRAAEQQRQLAAWPADAELERAGP